MWVDLTWRWAANGEHVEVVLVPKKRYVLEPWEICATDSRRRLHFLWHEGYYSRRVIEEPLDLTGFTSGDHLGNSGDINPLLPWLHHLWDGIIWYHPHGRVP